MKKVKITVLRTTFNEDFARDYGMPITGRCAKVESSEGYFDNILGVGDWGAFNPQIYLSD